MMMYYVHTELR